jgi:hypothetical protein
MDWSYDGIQKLIKLSAFAFTGWLISWILFFLLLPLMVATFGKAKGAAFNYGLSWVSMVVVILGLELFYRKKKEDISEDAALPHNAGMAI